MRRDDIDPDRLVDNALRLGVGAVVRRLGLAFKGGTALKRCYDIWYLTSEGHIDLAMLTPEIDSKLEFRKRTRDGFGEELTRMEKRYKKLWAGLCSLLLIRSTVPCPARCEPQG